MNEYKEIILGSEALAYVKRHVSFGLTLSKYVQENIDLNNGTVAEGFPENADIKRINNFDSGGFLATTPEEDWVHLDNDGQKSTLVPVSVDFKYVTDTINSFLASDERNCALFESSISKPSDPYLKRLQSKIWVAKEEVYNILNRELLFSDAIERTIRETRSSWVFVGYLTSFPEAKQDFLKTELTDGILLLLAKRVEKIIVGAYDNESFLIWHKTI